MYLKEVLNPQHFQALKGIFYDLDVENTKIEYRKSDGPLGVMASVRGTIFGYPNVIWLDPADFPKGQMINPETIQGLVICHEYVHMRQAAKGFWTRLSMWWANRTKEYPEGDYSKGRWHEVEAHAQDDLLREQWVKAIVS